jgi:hypothetical protein
MLLWLSSHFWQVLGGGMGGFKQAEEAAGNIALEAPFDLPGGASLCGATGDVGTGLGMEPHPGKHDGVQGAVELSVTAAVEAMSDGLAR